MWRTEKQEVSPLEKAEEPGGMIESERKLPGGVSIPTLSSKGVFSGCVENQEFEHVK